MGSGVGWGEARLSLMVGEGFSLTSLLEVLPTWLLLTSFLVGYFSQLAKVVWFHA